MRIFWNPARSETPVSLEVDRCKTYTNRSSFLFRIKSEPGKEDIVPRIYNKTVQHVHNQIKLYLQDKVRARKTFKTSVSCLEISWSALDYLDYGRLR
jgi:hypothetical protein